MEKYAFFDVDNTIYDGYTASDVLLYVSQSEVASRKYRDEFLELFSGYKRGKVSYSLIAQRTLEMFSECVAGMTVKEVKRFVNQLFDSRDNVIFDWVLPVLEFLRSNNYYIVLISAGPDVVIEMLADIIGGVNEWHATKIERDRNAFTGAVPEILNDTKKVKFVKSIIKKNSKAHCFSIAFGDSVGDIPMLEPVDRAYVVENDHHPDMMEYAREQSWRIFRNANEVIDDLKNLERD